MSVSMNNIKTETIFEILFLELNNHLRNTENKCITLSVGHLGLISLLIPIMYSESNEFFKGSTINIIVYSILIIMGCLVYLLQKWYRLWKEHYMEIIKKLMTESKTDDKFLPDWMKAQNNSSKFSIDDSIRYFNAFLNLISPSAFN